MKKAESNGCDRQGVSSSIGIVFYAIAVFSLVDFRQMQLALLFVAFTVCFSSFPDLVESMAGDK